MRKGTKLSRVRLLHDEGAALSLNFDSELRPLKAAIGAAELWAAENRVVLESLGITDTDTDVSAEDGEGEGEEGGVVKAEQGSEIQHGKGMVVILPTPPPTVPTLTYNDFAKIVASASQLVVDFSLVR